ncbi:SH3 domain-containing protein [Oligoflexaceae bacterium]|nr:SH3 domain-containing protein [Oligoflexaceae bacterium]
MRFLAFLVLVCSSQALAQNDPLSEQLAEAQVAYNQGQFETAASAYEQALSSGHRNGHIYYNLGNAYFRLGEKGKSMSAFLKARQYLPRDPDVKANLKFLTESIEDEVSTDFPTPLWSRMFFWIGKMNSKEQFYVGASLQFLGLCFFAAYYWLTERVWLRWCGLIVSFVSIFIIAGYVATQSVVYSVAAVDTPETSAYSGPSTKGNSIVFKLKEGAPVQVLQRSANWDKIRLSDGKKGWVDSKDLKIF